MGNAGFRDAGSSSVPLTETQQAAAKRKRLHEMIWDLLLVENILGLSIALVSAVLLNQVVQYGLDGMLWPVVGWLSSGKPLRELFLALNGVSYPSLKDAQDAGAPVVTWGAFLEALGSFLLMALVVILVVCWYRTRKNMRLRQPTPATESLRQAQALSVETAKINAELTERNQGQV